MPALPISAAAGQGQLVLLLGANGTGKSTLLRTIAGLQPSLSGEILLNGHGLSAMSRRQLAQTVAVVLTEKLHIPHMAVEQLVGMGRAPYTNFLGQQTAADRLLVDEAIATTRLQHLRNSLASQLSDGELQKVMIAKAIAQDTPIILLDEPTAFLDYPTKRECLQLLQQLAAEKQKTIILSTHDIELALPVANLVWFMQQGKALCQIHPEELGEHPDFQQFISNKAQEEQQE